MAYQGGRMMLYRAMRLPNGKVVCVDASVLNETTKIVRSSDEYYKAIGQGWCSRPDVALEQYEHEAEMVGQLAAERAYTDLRKSESAQREAEAYEATTPLHVPVIPEASR
jgi:hypothetical protein